MLALLSLPVSSGLFCCHRKCVFRQYGPLLSAFLAWHAQPGMHAICSLPSSMHHLCCGQQHVEEGP